MSPSDFLLCALGALLGSLLGGFVRAVVASAWKAICTPLFGGEFPLYKWRDGQAFKRVSDRTYIRIINLQTPGRRRQLRKEHAQWVARMKNDYNMDFSHTL